MPNRVANPRASVFAHPWITASTVAIVAVIGLIVALLFGHATYVAEATVRVSPTSPAQLARGSDPFSASDSYRFFVLQQAHEIASYGIISAALDRLGPRRSLWQRPHEEDRVAAERLMAKIKVTAVPDSYFITVDLEAESPKGLAEIVNAVVSEYLKHEANQELNGADEGTQLLNSRKTELEQLMANEQDQLNQLAQNLGIASIQGGMSNPYDKMLSDATAAAARAHLNVVLAKARLDSIKSHSEHITDLEIASKTQEMAANNPETTNAKEQLLQEREAALLELSGLGPNHPDRPALEQKIARINDELINLDQASLDKIRTSLDRSESAKSNVTISQAESALDQAQRAEQGVQQDLESLRSSATAFGAKYSQGIALYDKIDRERKELQDIDEQLRFLRLESRAPGFVSLESAALTPDLPQKGKRRKIFFFFVLVGLVLAVAVPTGLDLIDPKIGTVAELEAILGFPPLGATLTNDGRLAHEALRRIALGIRRERRASGVRTYVLTSVRERAGTTTLALALAKELCDLGVRAVAIQANPDSHDSRYVGKRNDKHVARHGLTAPNIRATCDLSREVAPTASLGSAARAVAKANDLLPQPYSISKDLEGTGLSFESARDSVEQALETFDVVLLDTPPLLTSADPVLLMQMPAGAILVVRAGRDEVSEIADAALELERLSPPVVGAVLTSGFLNGFSKNRQPDTRGPNTRQPDSGAAIRPAG